MSERLFRDEEDSGVSGSGSFFADSAAGAGSAGFSSATRGFLTLGSMSEMLFLDEEVSGVFVSGSFFTDAVAGVGFVSTALDSAVFGAGFAVALGFVLVFVLVSGFDSDLGAGAAFFSVSDFLVREVLAAAFGFVGLFVFFAADVFDAAGFALDEAAFSAGFALAVFDAGLETDFLPEACLLLLVVVRVGIKK